MKKICANKVAIKPITETIMIGIMLIVSITYSIPRGGGQLPRKYEILLLLVTSKHRRIENNIVKNDAKVVRAQANLLFVKTATINENIKGVITISMGKFFITNVIIFIFYHQGIFHDNRLNLKQKFHLHLYFHISY